MTSHRPHTGFTYLYATSHGFRKPADITKPVGLLYLHLLAFITSPNLAKPVRIYEVSISQVSLGVDATGHSGQNFLLTNAQLFTHKSIRIDFL